MKVRSVLVVVTLACVTLTSSLASPSSSVLSTSHVNSRVFYSGTRYSPGPPKSTASPLPSEAPVSYPASQSTETTTPFPAPTTSYPQPTTTEPQPTTETTHAAPSTEATTTASYTRASTTTTQGPTTAKYNAPQPRPSHLSYTPRPPSYQHTYGHKHQAPACSELTNATYCLEDEEYPEYEIKHAIQYHLDKFNSLYADVADLDTEASVERPDTLEEETYLCPSEIAYIRPLRAQNTEDKWRVIVNEIKLHYKTFTQTARVENCLTAGEACHKVPMCYESKCLQKSIYHRFLVYDPYDQYFPFVIETFKLPASCACLLGAYTIDH